MPKLFERAPIEGQVAAVVTDTQIVINRGQIHSVTKGMKFAVYLEIPEIRDPEDATNTLSGLRYKKGIMMVYSVLKKMSLCSLEPSRVTSNISFNYSTTTTTYPEVQEPLVTEDKWKIKIGDIVQEVIPEEEEAKKKPTDSMSTEVPTTQTPPMDPKATS